MSQQGWVHIIKEYFANDTDVEINSKELRDLPVQDRDELVDLIEKEQG